MKQKGFTLAEVLITLAIVGIVAALTIPTLISRYNEKVAISKLKKIYSTLSQAYLYAVQEYGPVKSWEISTDEVDKNADTYYPTNAILVYDRLFQNIRTLKTCNDSKNLSACDISKKYYYVDGTTDSVFTSSGAKACAALLSDGSSVALITYSKDNRGSGPLSAIYALVYIDTNGGSAAPNTYGRDFFFFYLTNDGIVPAGTQDEIRHPFSTCYTKGTGCPAWVIFNGNMDYLHCDGLDWNGKHSCS